VRSAVAALAQGAGGEFGRQAWAALARLVRAASGHSPAALDTVQAAQANPGDAHVAGDQGVDDGITPGAGRKP
jgi:hypothetical protein